jgi:GNAT superfamily N-acetyltransferase
VPDLLFSDVAQADAYRPHQAAGTLWVMDEGGEPVAYLAALAHGDRLHVDEFDVAFEHQGKGIGRRLLAFVIDWARANGFTSLSLTTFRSIPWNAPFYASAGFEEWDPEDAPASIRQALMYEASKGLTDRCAMRLVL